MTTYPVDNLPSRIILGKQTETGVREIRIDCAPWLEAFPSVSISLWAVLPGSKFAYPADTHMDGNVLVWSVSDADTSKSGSGYLEVMGMSDDIKKLSATAQTYIQKTITGTTTTPPTAETPWVNKVIYYSDKASSSAARAEAAAERAENAGGGGTGGSGTPGQDGGYYVPSVDELGNLTWTGSKPDMPDVPSANIKGDKGDKGDTGEPGEDGKDGKDGQDGHTPQRGTDYWTEADRQQIVSDVLAALPAAEGVAY